MSKQISRNRGDTIKASQKTVHDKIFLFWGKKDILMAAYPKIVIALNLYIRANVLAYERWLVLKVWYTATITYTHCLCM